MAVTRNLTVRDTTTTIGERSSGQATRAPEARMRGTALVPLRMVRREQRPNEGAKPVQRVSGPPQGFQVADTVQAAKARTVASRTLRDGATRAVGASSTMSRASLKSPRTRMRDEEGVCLEMDSLRKLKGELA